MLRRSFLSATLVALAIPGLASATSSLADIEAAIASGKPLLIHVTAPWCGTCQVQKPVVTDLLQKPEFSGLTKIDVDFDTQRDVLKRFRVQTQATMLVFKGGKEVDRQIGETDPKIIADLFERAM